MTDFYKTTRMMYVRFGLFSVRPATPPDKSALFWGFDTQKLYAVNDDMQWVIINPDIVNTGEMHVRQVDIATNNSPSVLMWEVPSLGALIWECRFIVSDAWDLGVTLSVGDSGDHERLMHVADITPQLPNDNFTPYTTTPMYQYDPGDAINLYMNMSSSTGGGTLYMLYDENPNTL